MLCEKVHLISTCSIEIDSKKGKILHSFENPRYVLCLAIEMEKHKLLSTFNENIISLKAENSSLYDFLSLSSELVK